MHLLRRICLSPARLSTGQRSLAFSNGSGFFPVGKMLEGVIVLELASVLAGPTAGQFLAGSVNINILKYTVIAADYTTSPALLELGAEVIKVENSSTNGDVTRIWKVPSEDKVPRIWNRTAVSSQELYLYWRPGK